jgi:hypothetical protein
MNDTDDEKLKAEIDNIMSNVTKTMERIEELNLINRNNQEQNKEQYQ